MVIDCNTVPSHKELPYWLPHETSVAYRQRLISQGFELVKIKGRLKWFDRGKGYGFISPDTATDSSGEVFLHIRCLLAGGYQCVGEGDEIHFEAVRTSKGLYACHIVNINANHCDTLNQSGRRSEFGPRKVTVKWFNHQRGFGFLTLPGGRDIFIHTEVVEKSRFAPLQPGQTVFAYYNQTKNGLLAVYITKVT